MQMSNVRDREEYRQKKTIQAFAVVAQLATVVIDVFILIVKLEWLFFLVDCAKCSFEHEKQNCMKD